MDISIVGKGDSLHNIDFSKVDTKRLSINYPLIPIKYDYICSYDFKPSKKNGIYVKDFKLQKTPDFNKEDKTTLGFYQYTVTSAVNWCYKQGFKNIYLIGIDHDTGFFNEPEVREWIELFKDKCNIYQTYNSPLWHLPYTNKFNKKSL